MAWYILLAFFIVLEFKVIRDIVAFRFSRSILTKLPLWLKKWLTQNQRLYTLRTSSFDGWHVSDAIIIGVPYVLAIWMELKAFWLALATYPLFWIVFYVLLFNVQFHWLWMLPEFRENPWKRQEEDVLENLYQNSRRTQ